jgi:hypothetical protein
MVAALQGMESSMERSGVQWPMLLMQPVSCFFHESVPKTFITKSAAGFCLAFVLFLLLLGILHAVIGRVSGVSSSSF